MIAVASGQHPDEIQHTLCEICGNPPDEMDHRLAIEVAHALGPAAMLRAFTPDNLRWLCRDCHRRKTGQDRRLAKFLSACSLDWHSARRMLRQHREWLQSFLLPCSLEPDPRLRASAAGRATQRWRIRQPVNTKYCDRPTEWANLFQRPASAEPM